MLYIYLSLASSSKIPVTRYVVVKLRSTFALQTHYMQACLSPITLVYDLDKHHLKADASQKKKFCESAIEKSDTFLSAALASVFAKKTRKQK